VQREYAPNLGATTNFLFLHLIKRELIRGLESTATDLSADLTLNKSTVSDTLHLLMERGYVDTEADIADDRRTLLWLNLSDAHYKALNESFSSVFLQATVSVEVGGREEAS
jgi:DNA-binding IclR family transcriptional regulator